MGSGRRLARRIVRLLAIASVIIAATIAALVCRRAVLERRLSGQASAGRLQHAADAGRSAMLQEIARIRVTLRDTVDAPPGVRSAKLAEFAGNDAGRTAMLLEDQRVTLFPTRVLRYVPDPPSGDIGVSSTSTLRAGALLRAARTDVMGSQPARALMAYNELARMHDVRIRSEPVALIARYERLPLLPRASRSAEAAALLHDLEAGRWTLSRSTYESYRDDLDYFVSDDRDIPLWEEAVHSVSAASRARADQGGEHVIWIDDSHPVLLVWRSGQAAAVALAVTGGHVADRWLRAERGFDYGIETGDDRAFLPRPLGEPHAQRILPFAGYEWRMITVASPAGRAVIPRRLGVRGPLPAQHRCCGRMRRATAGRLDARRTRRPSCVIVRPRGSCAREPRRLPRSAAGP